MRKWHNQRHLRVIAAQSLVQNFFRIAFIWSVIVFIISLAVLQGLQEQRRVLNYLLGYSNEHLSLAKAAYIDNKLNFLIWVEIYRARYLN
jgi:hypothetical protein